MTISRRQFLGIGTFSILSSMAASGWMSAGTQASVGLKQPLRDASIPLGNAQWRRQAIARLWHEHKKAGSTPLIVHQFPFNSRSKLLLKNEAMSVTGSLKHRVAWALVMWGLIGSGIRRDLHLFERTSGNTGIAEAYFAQRLGLSYTAVAAAGISPLKLKEIRRYGGRVLLIPQGVSPLAYYRQVLADDPLSYDINQFANAEKAISYFQGPEAETENLANELVLQLQELGISRPEWFVMAAGSGGTATSIGRYMRKWNPGWSPGSKTQLLVPDPEHSVLFDWYRTGNAELRSSKPILIEGVGSRGPIIFGSTFSLQRGVVDRMLKVPDALTVAGMHLANDLVGFRVGPSTGLNLVGALHLACEAHQYGRSTNIATVICDSGELYSDNYYNPDWLAFYDLDWQPLLPLLRTAWEQGSWPSQL